MPVIHFKGHKLICSKGANLRETLIASGLHPHNGTSRMLNCFGLGTCGTCAVKITGRVSEMTPTERLRLSFPPHNPENGLRLACQVKVMGDIEVVKWEGFWGQSPPK